MTHKDLALDMDDKWNEIFKLILKGNKPGKVVSQLNELKSFYMVETGLKPGKISKTERELPTIKAIGRFEETSDNKRIVKEY